MSTLAELCPNSASHSGLDMMFLTIMGALVFFMQAGFALLEAGSTGVTSVTSILFKNVADVMVGSVAWWATGYAFAYGPEGTRFIGSKQYFLMDIELCDYANWFYQWTFAATAVTIVSGAMAGRTKLAAYITYSTLITGFIYPVVVHWTWSGDAWLSDGDSNTVTDESGNSIGYTDFAGSGIVHCTGGIAALVGAYFVGPRGTDNFENYESKADIPGHSMPLVALGTFILFFGFIGFNGGSVLSLDGGAGAEVGMPVMSLAVVNTVLAASGGGFASEFINWIVVGRKYLSLMQVCNGMIAGMVAICAGANVVYPWAAFIIGLGGGCSYKLWSWGVSKVGIDDAIDAAAVHLGAGLWGVVAVTLFAFEDNGIAGLPVCGGIFYNSDCKTAWHRLGWNLLGSVVICVWTATTSIIIFATLKKFNMLRVDDKQIEAFGGLDFVEHGEMAYIMFGVSQGKRHDSIDENPNAAFVPQSNNDAKSPITVSEL